MSEPTFADVMAALQRNADTAARLLVAAELLRDAQQSPANGPIMQVSVPPPDSGERAAMRTEKYTYLLGGLLIGTLMWFGMSQLDQGRKIERTQDYLNMLWQRNPELRPDKLNHEKPKK